ncbi:hypothetical protein [Rothia aeria]|uniref:hypothetical protein n=1 Tax=Rothia aeria TaxID=172042 RepID=UPI001E592E4B|nr:hypothetical protein [Rothia aeria]
MSEKVNGSDSHGDQKIITQAFKLSFNSSATRIFNSPSHLFRGSSHILMTFRFIINRRVHITTEIPNILVAPAAKSAT